MEENNGASLPNAPSIDLESFLQLSPFLTTIEFLCDACKHGAGLELLRFLKSKMSQEELSSKEGKKMLSDTLSTVLVDHDEERIKELVEIIPESLTLEFLCDACKYGARSELLRCLKSQMSQEELSTKEGKQKIAGVLTAVMLRDDTDEVRIKELVEIFPEFLTSRPLGRNKSSPLQLSLCLTKFSADLTDFMISRIPDKEGTFSFSNDLPDNYSLREQICLRAVGTILSKVKDFGSEWQDWSDEQFASLVRMLFHNDATITSIRLQLPQCAVPLPRISPFETLSLSSSLQVISLTFDRSEQFSFLTWLIDTNNNPSMGNLKAVAKLKRLELLLTGTALLTREVGQWIAQVLDTTRLEMLFLLTLKNGTRPGLRPILDRVASSPNLTWFSLVGKDASETKKSKKYLLGKLREEENTTLIHASIWDFYDPSDSDRKWGRLNCYVTTNEFAQPLKRPEATVADVVSVLLKVQSDERVQEWGDKAEKAIVSLFYGILRRAPDKWTNSPITTVPETATVAPENVIPASDTVAGGGRGRKRKASEGS